MRSNHGVYFPNTAFSIRPRCLDELYGDGAPHWRSRRTGKSAKTVNQAIGQRAKDIRRLRKRGDVRAAALADLLEACCPTYRCGSAGCAVCWRAFQRLFVQAARPLKPKFAGPMSVVSIVSAGRIPTGELRADVFVEFAASVRGALAESEIVLAAGGLDVNVNELKYGAPYWRLQAWLIMPELKGAREANLRSAFSGSQPDVRTPMLVQMFDGDNAALGYALKGDFDRRQTIPAHDKDDGSHVRQNTRDRNLTVDQENELLIVRHELCFNNRLILHNISLGKNGRFRLPKL